MHDPKQVVQDGFDRIAEAHGAWAEETRREEREKYTAALMNRLEAGADILELGCGAGGSTTRTLATSFRLTGVDLSARSVELARAAIPTATFVQSDMTRAEFPLASFDAVAAFYSIFHVPRAEHAPLLGRIRGWLRPGGLLVATMGAHDNPGELAPDWLGAPMYWSAYDADTNRDLVQNAGFEIEQATIETAPELGGPVSFLWVIARRLARLPQRP